MKLLPGKLLERLEDDFFFGSETFGGKKVGKFEGKYNFWEVVKGPGENGMIRYDCILMIYDMHIVYIYDICYHCNMWYFLDLDHADSSLDSIYKVTKKKNLSFDSATSPSPTSHGSCWEHANPL